MAKDRTQNYRSIGKPLAKVLKKTGSRLPEPIRPRRQRWANASDINSSLLSLA